MCHIIKASDTADHCTALAACQCVGRLVTDAEDVADDEVSDFVLLRFDQVRSAIKLRPRATVRFERAASPASSVLVTESECEATVRV